MGFITFKLSKLEPMLMKKKEIEPEKLKDYLIASACFPAFKEKIDTKIILMVAYMIIYQSIQD